MLLSQQVLLVESVHDKQKVESLNPCWFSPGIFSFIPGPLTQLDYNQMYFHSLLS